MDEGLIAPARRRGARPEHRRRARRDPDGAAGAGRVPRAGHDARLRRPRRDRVRRRRARAGGRDRRAGADPVRGRAPDLVAAAAAGGGAGGAAQHRRRRRQRAADRRRRVRCSSTCPGSSRSCSAPSSRRPTRRPFRDAPLHAHPPPARAHARGRVGRQRPDGDRAHARPDRLDRATGATASTTSSLLVVRQIGLGLLVGIALGAAATWVFARLPHAIGAFAPVASVAAAALSFGAADVIGGSGFLAVYLVGLAVGSTPSRTGGSWSRSTRASRSSRRSPCSSCSACSSFRATSEPSPSRARARVAARARRPPRRRLGVDGVQRVHHERAAAPGLGRPARRGADRARDVRPVVARRPADTIFNAVFFVVIVSAIVQGTTLERVAHGLGLVSPAPPRHEAPIEVGVGSKLELIDFAVAADHAVAGSAVRELGLPRRRSSPSSRAATSRSRRAAARSSCRATACSCSRRGRSGGTSTTSSRAGGGASKNSTPVRRARARSPRRRMPPRAAPAARRR